MHALDSSLISKTFEKKIAIQDTKVELFKQNVERKMGIGGSASKGKH